MLFAGHGVAIRLERRPRIRQGVDDPQVLDLAHVTTNDRELARVARPGHGRGGDARVLGVDVLALFLLLLVVLLLLLLLLLLILLVRAPAAAAE